MQDISFPMHLAQINVACANYLRFEMPASEVRNHKITIHVIYGNGTGENTIGMDVYGQISAGAVLFYLIGDTFKREDSPNAGGDIQQIVSHLNESRHFEERLAKLIQIHELHQCPPADGKSFPQGGNTAQ